MKRLLLGILVIALLFLCVLLAGSFAYLAWSVVLPAIREGGLIIETNSMILNVLWEGNEIYALLVAYLILAFGFAYGAIRASEL
jgi:hypothetical protein